MTDLAQWIAQAQSNRPDDFPLTLTPEEQVALLPFWLHRTGNDSDSAVYDELRQEGLPHSLKMAGWDYDRLTTESTAHPAWQSSLTMPTMHAVPTRPHDGDASTCPDSTADAGSANAVRT